MLMNMDTYDTAKLINSLIDGGVVVMPTDTVYGLVCLARNPDAVKKMYEVKQRDGKPGTIIAGSVDQLISMGFDETEAEIASRFWPGPVSVILSTGDNLEYLHMGKKSLAVRIPDVEWLHNLLLETSPLATTSANLPGEPTVTNIEQAQSVFGEKIDFYLDGGEIINSKPSKIVRILQNGDIETIRH